MISVMSNAKRAPGLVRPGTWLAGIVMPPPKLDAWGMTWRLVVRLMATTVMTGVAVLAVWSAVTAPRNVDWIELGMAISGWLVSALLTVGVMIAVARRRRKTNPPHRSQTRG
jgi:hypothetical protein